MKKILTIAGIIFSIPLLTFAQASNGNSYINYYITLIQQVSYILHILIPILVTAAIVIFFIGLVQYIFKPDDKEKPKKTMIAGIVSIFIMVSLWGIISLLQNVAGVNPNYVNPIQQGPQVQ